MNKTKKAFEMPKEFLEKWLKALRSGEYKQGEDLLYNPKEQSYCCLGVACVIDTPDIDKDYYLNVGLPIDIDFQEGEDITSDNFPKILYEHSKNSLVRISTRLFLECS
jgi:hypothetical protein